MYNVYFQNIGTLLSSPRNFTFFPGITPLPIQLTCDVTLLPVAWKVNNIAILLFTLPSRQHDRNGNDILINNPMSNSEYICSNGRTDGQPYYIFVAGKYIYVYKCMYRHFK